MADSILSGTLQKVLVQIASLAVKEISLACCLEGNLERLRKTLTNIGAVLSDAEEQRFTNHKISLWLRRLRNVLYDAEDVLADFAYEVARQEVISSRGGIGRKVSRYLSSSNPCVYRLRIAHKIKEVRKKLDDIKTDKDEFNLNERVDQGCLLRLKERERTNSVVNSQVIGRDEDREKIVKLLRDSGGHDVSVVSIVGIGGMGKTALAKLVYNDRRIVDHFDTKVWVCLGDMKKFDVHQVTATITAETKSQGLENFIQEKVRGKKFLLVLDDLWDADRSKWSEVKGMLSSGARGSKILVTTRDGSVSQCVGTVPAHHLGGLSHERCVSLFKELAFCSEAEVNKNLMRIGDQIVRRCKGVPLAVRTLASHLYSKGDEREWVSVRDSDIWQINGEQNDIMAILKFSYDRLPSHLKSCFVYCSVFPEDYGFSDHKLISFWMAHGLLKGRDPEYVGKQYINEFLCRGFFQDSRQLKTFWGVFKMHDLVWELARSLAKDEFRVGDAELENVSQNDRHVWFDSRRPENLANSDDHSHVRSVLISRSGVEHVKAFSSKCKNLRVLWVTDSNILELPECVGSLKYLKHLSLVRCRNLKKLADAICELHGLETLSLFACRQLEEIPKSIGELISLRWLDVTTKQKHLPKNGIESLTSLQFLWFHNCPNLETLFEGSHIQLKSLRTLIVTACPNLKSFCRPTSKQHSFPALENLELTRCASIDDVSEFLHTTPNLVSLEIINLERWKTWSSPFLECAHTLRKLKIHRCDNLVALPEWLPNLTSLETLDLEDCSKLEYL